MKLNETIGMEGQNQRRFFTSFMAALAMLSNLPRACATTDAMR